MQVNRATKLTEAEKGVLSKCALCGQCAAGRRNEHLLFKCTDARGRTDNENIVEVAQGDYREWIKEKIIEKTIKDC